MKKRLIYAEDAKEALLGWGTDPTDEEIEYTIDKLPTAEAAEVVRCKDCKHYFHYGDEVYGCRTYGMIKTNLDGFCSHGERKYNEML